MGKSLRSSRLKTNKSNLRAKVHEPVEVARVERLSAKLLELARKPKELEVLDGGRDEDMMNGNSEGLQNAVGQQERKAGDVDSVMDGGKTASALVQGEKMDIDGKNTKKASSSSSFRSKKASKILKKRQAKVVFAVGKQHGKSRHGKGYKGPGIGR